MTKVGPSQPLIMVTVIRKKTAFYEVDTSSRPYLQEGLDQLVDTRLKYYKHLYILNDSDVSARGGMNKNMGGHLIEIPTTSEFFLLPWVRNVAFLTLSRHSTREREKGSIKNLHGWNITPGPRYHTSHYLTGYQEMYTHFHWAFRMATRKVLKIYL